MVDKLLEKAREGDKGSTEEIINRLQPLIISSIRKYYNKPNEYEDLVQDGNLKILECIRDYEPSKGVHFLGYVKTMLRYLYLDKHKHKYHLSLNEVVGDGEVELMDLLVSDDKEPLAQILDREDKKKLLEALNTLTERQKEIVILYYFENMKIEDIAAKLEVSYRTVVNTKTRAIEKMFQKGLIKGIGDGKFAPKSSVTKLEAIIMSLRVMGWEDDAKAITELPKEYKGDQVDKWAVGYVSLAYEKGILDDVDMMYFKPHFPGLMIR